MPSDSPPSDPTVAFSSAINHHARAALLPECGPHAPPLSRKCQPVRWPIPAVFRQSTRLSPSVPDPASVLLSDSWETLIEYLKGLVGGVLFIFSIHAVNAFLGCASFSWPHIIPSLDIIAWLKVYGQMGLLIVQGTVMASAISLVEELLFRSWLPQEIAVDLGYHKGIIISGLAFSFLQRSLSSIPGLLLLSLSLSGARQRNRGSLYVPIGLRAGMLASTFILQRGGFLTYNYKGNIPLWVIGSHPFQPFSGLVGLVFCLSLAIILYPRETSQKSEAKE
ncbi:hypothetical protein KIW84_040694 [Lathyrus oleraceus]|uniref:CAAX prenyl protease 2/Lysostaphin resistance protein A-like domain-containing protein n=1 Tax=Pisum sativum TaxID=3888 RepID=A0A9D5AQG7_PEA|nr:hypothetical protein KIW84_040694 [Pisum sativum]